MTNGGLGKPQRRRKLGIECPDRLVWKSWEPGEEHVRKLVIKNIESRAQVITFTLPEQRTTFLTPFPEPVTLSSGMSHEVTVRFCPTELLEVHDRMEIQVKGRGSLTVALDALTPFARMACAPKTHDFGFCAVRTTATNQSDTIKMTNSGTVPLDYYWEAPAPFAVSPAHGHLEPGQSQQLRVSFCPTEACAVLCQAVCRMQDLEEALCTLQLSGVGKYPFVRLRPACPEGTLLAGATATPPAAPVRKDGSGKPKSTPTAITATAAPSGLGPATTAFNATMSQETPVAAQVDFHEVPAGCMATHEFVVENPSPVSAQVTLNCPSQYGYTDPINDGSDVMMPVSDRSGSAHSSSAFHVQPAATSIPAGGQQVYKVTFRAASTGSQNETFCELRSTAGNTIRLGLRGTVVGPRVKASTSYLNYGDVDLSRVGASDNSSPVTREAQQLLVRHVTLTNTGTAQSCYYQFLATTPGAAFSVEPAMGAIAPGQSVRLRVTFRPTAPVHYLRRLFLLVQDSAEVLYVDCFGTAFLGDVRPPPLGLPEVDAFFARIGAGLAQCTPAELEEAATVGGDGARMAGTLEEMMLWNAADMSGQGSIMWATRKGTGRLPFAEAAEQLAMPLLCAAGQQSQRSGPAGPNGAPFSLDCKVLTFSRGPPTSAPSDSAGVTSVQLVAVCNSSPEPAVATWAVPAHSAFAVTPMHAEVPANGSVQFQVVFRAQPAASSAEATASSLLFAGQPQFLECYVNYAQMSSFRYVRTRAAVTPPHCLLLQCRRDGAAATAPSARSQAAISGNTKKAGRGGAAAAAPDRHVFASNAFVSFPACHVGGSSYQVLSLVNDGDVAHMFELKGFVVGEVSEKVHKDITVLDRGGAADSGRRAVAQSSIEDDGADAVSTPSATGVMKHEAVDVGATFTCYPHTGLLPPHHRALFLIRFHPTCHARYEAELQLQVYTSGSSYHDMVCVALHGETDIPRLELVTSPTHLYDAGSFGARLAAGLTFPPTCVTGEARLSLWLSNPTSLAVDYELTPSNELLGVVRFEPAAGVLQAGERRPVSACFAPETAHRYEGNVVLFMQAARCLEEARSSSSNEYVSTWPVLGEGTHGVVEVEPTEMDLGTVGGLEPQTVAITLYNSGVCEVGYEVRSLTCREPPEWRHTAPPPTLRNHTGTIPARTHRVVLVTVHPAAAGLAEYLVYAMIAGLGTDISRVPSPTTAEEAERHPHCRLAIRGTRPAVQVADVRSLTQLRSHLWRQLSIPALNRQLAAPVQPHDVATDMYAFHQFMEGLTPVTMELAAGPRHGVPAVFMVRLENVGDCAADFSLWLPTESSVTEENWFLEDGALKDIQLILDKRIIEVSPRSGSIPAGGSTVLTLVYRFVEVGIHTLPVVLRVADGRRALIVLEGRTLPDAVSCLTTHGASAEYELLPVALGDVEPPMQSVMVLDNALDVAVKYTVDQQALRQLAEANYGFPILQCVNPTGVLPPRSMTELHWYFRPLETKEYTMSVPILTSTVSASDDGSAAERQFEEEEEEAAGESYTYTFVGRGYHPHQTPAEEVRALTELAFLSIPSASASPSAWGDHTATMTAAATTAVATGLLPSLPVLLAPEVFHIGATPFFTLHRSCCTLINTHPTDTFTFEFDTRHAFGDHLLTIQPVRGRLPPNGGRVDCRVTFYSGSTSQLLQWSVPCRLFNQTAVEEAMAVNGVDATADHTAIAAGSPVVPAAPEYFAVDGKGLQLMQQEGASTHAKRAGFERSTCTKAGLMRLRRQQGRKRLPVTAIPAESLGVAALSRRVLAGREGGGTVGTVGAGVSCDSEAVVSAVVELFVQARVMPVEEYERVYGRESLRGTYQPLVSMFQDPVEMATSAGGSRQAVTVDEASVAREVMEELVRAVVAQPTVRTAFTEPHRSNVVYYKDVKSSQLAKVHQQKIAGTPAVRNGNKVLAGLVGNVLEEAMEELVFQAVMTAVAEGAT